jgi:hypothetical protein
MLYGDDPLKLNNYNYSPSLVAIIQSGNLYAYCGNNPIMYVDESGNVFMLATGAVGAVIGGIGGAIHSYSKYGEVRWKNVAAGAAIGGATGLIGGAAASFVKTGSIATSAHTVLTAGSNWTATMTASGATSSAAIGRTFEKWFYEFNNIGKSAQQIAIKGLGRVDAFSKGTIYELKNYNWSKYSGSQINNVTKGFVSQAQRHLQVDKINGEKVKNLVYYFSEKPPQEVIDALKNVGAKVQWVPK